MSAPKPPAGLGPAGRDLWRRVLGAFELDPHEIPGLPLAARQLDDVAAWEQLLAGQGPVTVGSTGQPRLSAVVTELRQSRLAVAKLLDGLRLPLDLAEEKRPSGPMAERGRRAAEARWARERRRGAAS